MFDMSDVRNLKKTKIKKLIIVHILYIFVNLMFYSSADKFIFFYKFQHSYRWCADCLAEYIYEKKRKTLICWLLRIAEDTLFCFQSVKFSRKLAYGPRRLSNDCHHFRTVCLVTLTIATI